jgi:hypothetical protein
LVKHLADPMVRRDGVGDQDSMQAGVECPPGMENLQQALTVDRLYPAAPSQLVELAVHSLHKRVAAVGR